MIRRALEDPFAWLEEDSDASLQWQFDQDARTIAHLSRWPDYELVRERVPPFVASARVAASVPAGGRWFTATAAGLTVSDEPTGDGRVIRTDRLDWFFPSPDGTLVAVGVSEGGGEQSVLQLVEADTARVLPERIPFASFSHVAWLPDSSGFYYSAGTAPDTEDAQKHIWFHRLGHPPPQVPERVPARVRFCVPQISADGRYVTCHPSEVEPRPDHVLDRVKGGGWRPFLRDARGTFVGCFHADRFMAVTSDGADRGRIVAVPVDGSPWTELVPETDAVLRALTVVADKLVVIALVDVSVRIRIHALDGRLEHELPLPEDPVGLEGGAWLAEPPVAADSTRISFVVSTPTASGAPHVYDVPTRRLTRLRPPAMTLDDATVRRIDRAWIVHRGALAEPRPTLIHAYGGWNAAFMPTWPGGLAAIVEAGGVLVLANLRGGGELGDRFWREGRREHKQRAFDDLFTIAERLIADGIAAPDRLALVGASNGGLLAATALTQRPELWKAVVSLVPVTDLLRFAKDDHVAQGVEEAGDDADVLAAYSPYHRVTPGTAYPATLVGCAGDDVRCPPWHSRKLVAALQRSTAGTAPILLRAWPGASHLQPSTDPDLVADWLGFLVQQLGLRACDLRARSAPAAPR